MLIIVEGFDNSGKTSLVNHLVRKHTAQGPALVFHSNSEVNQSKRLVEISQWAWHSFRMKYPKLELIICDRIGIIGEEVYGRQLRGHNVFNEPLRETWINFISFLLPDAFPVIFIWCNPAQHTMGNKREMGGVVENRKTLLGAYNTAMQTTKEVFTSFQHRTYDIQFLEFDYQTDPHYVALDKLIYRKEN